MTPKEMTDRMTEIVLRLHATQGSNIWDRFAKVRERMNSERAWKISYEYLTAEQKALSKLMKGKK